MRASLLPAGPRLWIPRLSVHDVVTRDLPRLVKSTKGPGGRSSDSGYTATVFGATGFLGRYVVNNLGRQGTQVVIPYRGNQEETRHLKVMGDLGQIVQLRFHLENEAQIVECIRHSDVVYNLIGSDYPTKNFSFEKVHIDGARRIAKLAANAGVSKLIHVSALGADPNSKSKFLKTKALGEEAVRSEFPDATIVRPGWMYGSEDYFWNRIGYFGMYLGVLPIVNSGKTRMRPVLSHDVALALSKLLTADGSEGKTFELYGPREYFLLGLYELFADASKRRPYAVHLPKFAAKLLAGGVNAIQAYPLISPDEVERYYIDDKISPGALTFADLGIKPKTAEETISPFTRIYRPVRYMRVSA
ncbi:hypothetical protein BJ742DRAFT_801706 [Cladochytrium replicatum]|nr:hypothetical protein BJ742DRAFT_801706 [Cladochytrium replicatum]